MKQGWLPCVSSSKKFQNFKLFTSYLKTLCYNFLRKNSHKCIVYTNKVLYICIVKKSKLYVVQINSDIYYYKTLKGCYMNHDLGVSLNTLYRVDFDTMDYTNDVCTIKKRFVQ